MTNPIYDLLVSKGHTIKMSGQDYLIHCLNPEHDDKNPSLRIDINTGKFRCPVCGYGGNILKYYNILTSSVSIKVHSLMRSIAQIKEALTDLSFPKGSIMFKNTFKGISPKTLQKFEAFYTTQVPDLDDRIIFPIRNVLGKIQCFIGRHTLADSGAKYKVYPAGAPLTCFPINIDTSKKYIVLVEGIFDMLNLHDKGLANVICSFGVDFLTKNTGSKLLPYKVQGVSTIFLMYDGDNAGRNAAKKLKPILEENLFNVEIIDLPDGSDPGILTAEEIQFYSDIINEKSSHY